MELRDQGQIGYSAGYLQQIITGRKVSNFVLAINLTGANVLDTMRINAELVSKDKSIRIYDDLKLSDLEKITDVFGGSYLDTSDGTSTVVNLTTYLGDGNAIMMDDGEELHLSASWPVTSLTAGSVKFGSIAHDSDSESYVPVCQAQTLTFAGADEMQTVIAQGENVKFLALMDATNVSSIQVQTADEMYSADVEVFEAFSKSAYRIESTLAGGLLVLKDDSNLISSVSENPKITLRSSGAGTVTLVTFGMHFDAKRAAKNVIVHNERVVRKIEKIQRKYPQRFKALKHIGFARDAKELRRELELGRIEEA